MTVLALVGAGFIVFAGSLVQRLTGMGLSLVASPFLVLVLGPQLGVQTILVIGTMHCTLTTVTLRRDVNWRRAALLIATAAVGLLPGLWLVRSLPTAWLLVTVGAVTIVALLFSLTTRRNRLFEGTHGVVVTGGVSGFMTATAAVGGPPLAIYARTNSWRYTEYLATVQAYFAAINLLTLVGRGLPVLPAVAWVVLMIAALLGLLIGHPLSRRIDEKYAHAAIIIVAFVGSVATLIRGLMAL